MLLEIAGLQATVGAHFLALTERGAGIPYFVFAGATDDDVPAIGGWIELHRAAVPAATVTVAVNVPQHLGAVGFVRSTRQAAAVNALQAGAPGQMMGIPQHIVGKAVVHIVTIAAHCGFGIGDHDIVGQRGAGRDAMPGILDIAALDQYRLGGIEGNGIAIAAFAEILGLVDAAVANRDARRIGQANAIARVVAYVDIVDPAVTHAFKVDAGTDRAARAGIAVVLEFDADPGQTQIRARLNPAGLGSTANADGIVGRIEGQRNGGVQADIPARNAGHLSQIAEGGLTIGAALRETIVEVPAAIGVAL